MSKMTDDIEAWLLSFECGKAWFSTITSPRTKDMYSKDLKQYCNAVGKTPDELLELKVEGLRNVATAKEFQAEKLLDSFLYNSPDVSIHIKISILCAVKSFYKENWRELNKKVGEKLTVPQAKKRTPTMQDLLEMDEVMMYQRDKAILWFLESAPFRVGTLTKLMWKDLKPTGVLLKENREKQKGQTKSTLEEDQRLAKLIPYYFEVEADRMKGAGQGKYVGAKQIAFLHHYAVEKLEKYKLELKKYCIEPKQDSQIFLAYTNNPYNKGKGDTLKNIGVIFTNACSMAWNDENKKFSPQDMRDFLQSSLERVEVNPNLISPLLGHKVKGVDKHYSNHDIEEFLQVFLKALPLLVPQTVEQVKAETEKKLEEDKKQISEVKYQNNSLKQEVNGLHERDKARDKEIADLWAMLQKLSDSQRKTIEAQMRKSEEEAQEAERQENAKRLSETTPEEEETIKANLKKLPQIIEENKKRQKEEAEDLKD